MQKIKDFEVIRTAVRSLQRYLCSTRRKDQSPNFHSGVTPYAPS